MGADEAAVMGSESRLHRHRGSPAAHLAGVCVEMPRGSLNRPRGPGMISGKLINVDTNAANVFEEFNYCPIFTGKNSEAHNTDAIAPGAFGSHEILYFQNITAAHIHLSQRTE